MTRRALRLLNTEEMSSTLRTKTWDPTRRELLVARFQGSDQEADLSEAPNCQGVGRIRHFHHETSLAWPDNPLPIAPASRYSGVASTQVVVAQVFQNLACNWRCWYCYVPFNLLNGDPKKGEFVTAAELVRRYQAEPNPPSVLDISGGQPDLIPEWTFDTLRALSEVQHGRSPYVWTDDNLSTDYLWQFLTESEISWMAEQPNHGRVGCFKGFDAESFSFNTRATPNLFDGQFDLFERLIDSNFDMYAYVTLTSPTTTDIQQKMTKFVDRLQSIHPQLPLRTVPLEIAVFGPVSDRLDAERQESIAHQHVAIELWQQELSKRFSNEQRALSICDVSIRL